MSSDHLRTQRVSTAHRRVLWVLVTCTVAVAAFALAWILRPTGDARCDGSDDPPPPAAGCSNLTAKLTAAEARIVELDDEHARCLKRMTRLDSCLAKQLDCEKNVKEGAARLADAEKTRADALSEKNRVAAKASDSLHEVNESNEKISRLTEERDNLRRRLDDQTSKSRTDYSELKKRLDRLCAECGARCARTCSR